MVGVTLRVYKFNFGKMLGVLNMCDRHNDIGENQYWIRLFSVLAIVAIFFIGVVGYNVYHSNIYYKEMYSKCISDNGTWVPTAGGYAVCIRK